MYISFYYHQLPIRYIVIYTYLHRFLIDKITLIIMKIYIISNRIFNISNKLWIKYLIEYNVLSNELIRNSMKFGVKAVKGIPNMCV